MLPGKLPQTHHVRRLVVSIVIACVTGASSSDSINERLRHDLLVGIMANCETDYRTSRRFVLPFFFFTLHFGRK